MENKELLEALDRLQISAEIGVGRYDDYELLRTRLTEANALTEAIGEKEAELIKLRALVEKQTLQIAKRNGKAKANEAAIRDLAKALEDLLEDTQHAEHTCNESDCPVKIAEEVLKTHAKAIEGAGND